MSCGIKELTPLAAVLLHDIKALCFRSKTRSSGSSLLFSVASPHCILLLGFTKTHPSVEDRVLRTGSSPCLLYRAVHHINIKISASEVPSPAWSHNLHRSMLALNRKNVFRNTISVQYMRQRKSFVPATLEANSRKLQFQGRKISLNSSNNRCP